ncbi:hypothetical protein BC332_29786 [Capsicum chinense]|nr:hypothetical protein BC332_29786 [Capsicum chinense]
MILSNIAIFSLFFSTKSRIIVLIFFLFILLSPSYCLYHKPKLQDSIKGLLMEEKTRLGSIPPSCYNKCNQCHPCMAVQVPTTPSHNRAESNRVKNINRAELSRAKNMPMQYFESSSPSIGANRYSNYKPLGWKCRCDDHFYNP